MQSIRVLLALVLLVPPAQAGDRPQTPPSGEWKEVAQVVSGACIAVVGLDQIQRKAKLRSWNEQELTVSGERGRQVVYPRDQVLRIGTYKRCSSSRAALYGAVIGFTIGVVATAIIGGGLCVECEEGGASVVGALAAGGAVAATSALVAARSSDQPVRWIYEKR